MSEICEERFKKNSSLVALIYKEIEGFCINNNLNKNDDIYNFRSKRIDRILGKLALGHMVFEVSEGFYTGNEEWDISVVYSFFPTLGLNEIEDIDAAIDISDSPVPEIGSRIFEHIYVVETNIKYKCYKKEFLMLDWIDIQEGKYRYLCAKLVDRIVVKVVINEFLYSIITYTKKEL